MLASHWEAEKQQLEEEREDMKATMKVFVYAIYAVYYTLGTIYAVRHEGNHEGVCVYAVYAVYYTLGTAYIVKQK